jgi:hypothetical protein
LWLTAAINSNQLYAPSFSLRIMLNQAQNKIAKAIAVPSGMICSIAPEDFPPANNDSQ